MALTGTSLHSALILGFALVALVLARLAHRAYGRTKNTKMLLVMAAFLVFTLKGVITAYALYADLPRLGHENLELLGASMDLVVVLLLVAPFLSRSEAT